jgi:hypothetical protein
VSLFEIVQGHKCGVDIWEGGQRVDVGPRGPPPDIFSCNSKQFDMTHYASLEGYLVGYMEVYGGKHSISVKISRRAPNPPKSVFR